jgi:hypothetical protein
MCSSVQSEVRVRPRARRAAAVGVGGEPGEQDERGAEHLAPVPLDVLAQVRDRRDVGLELGVEAGLDAFESPPRAPR